MRIEREHPLDPTRAHHLEADGIGKADALIAEATKPAVNRRAFQLAADKTGIMRRILVDAVEKAHSIVAAAKARYQDLHLGEDEVGRHEPCSGFDPRGVYPASGTMRRLLWA